LITYNEGDSIKKYVNIKRRRYLHLHPYNEGDSIKKSISIPTMIKEKLFVFLPHQQLKALIKRIDMQN
jgi:hypothetical protein